MEGSGSVLITDPEGLKTYGSGTGILIRTTSSIPSYLIKKDRGSEQNNFLNGKVSQLEYFNVKYDTCFITK